VSLEIEKPAPTNVRVSKLGRGFASKPFLVLVLIALTIGLFVAALVLASRTSPRAVSQPSNQLTVSRDAEVVRYRDRVSADAHSIDIEYQKGWTCKTRDHCLSAVADVKTAAAALLTDVATFTAPASLTAAAQQLKAAAEQFVVQLDVAAAVIQQPDSDFVAAFAAPNLHDLDLAAATITCWPVKPFENGYHTNFDCA
jgi:hypothetical protein